jgi:hypothetical protein
VTAAALVGAFVGAVAGALTVLTENPDYRADPAAMREAMQKATDIALHPWTPKT